MRERTQKEKREFFTLLCLVFFMGVACGFGWSQEDEADASTS